MMVDVVMIVVFVIIFLVITLMIIYMPTFVKKRILFCSNCKSGSLNPKSTNKDEDIPCKKCKKAMEWLEIPEDMYRRLLFLNRLAYAILFPICIYVLLIVEIIPAMGGEISPLDGIMGFFSCIGYLIGYSIFQFVLKKQILNWAKKSS